MAMRRTMASCWKSFSPNSAKCGNVAVNSFVTTVATPSKCPGRDAPSIVSVNPATWTLVAKPSGYIVAGVGAYATSTPASRQAARSSSSGRG